MKSHFNMGSLSGIYKDCKNKGKSIKITWSIIQFGKAIPLWLYLRIEIMRPSSPGNPATTILITNPVFLKQSFNFF